MPALKSIRQERFCQLVKQGIPPYRAYPMAGYNFHESSPYRLRDNARVKARVAELTRGLAVKTLVTVQSLTDELDAVQEGAVKSEQFGAARAAIETKAKLHGLLVDRKESGQPGDFSGLKTPEEVLNAIRAELGEAAAALLQAALAKPADELPAMVESSEPRDPGQPLN